MSRVRVAVTRPGESAEALAEALVVAGAAPVMVPLLRIEGPIDPAPLHTAAAHLDRYDWLVFTSANGVRALAAAAAAGLAGPRTACVGTATAQALADHGREADLVPERGDAKSLAAALIREVRDGAPGGVAVLWPRAEGAPDELSEDLRRAGMRVDAPVAYRTVRDAEAADDLARLIRHGHLDVVTLTSPSAVDALAAALAGDAGGVRIAVIGAVTARAARSAGLHVDIEPAVPTVAALAAAIMTADRGR